MATASPLVTTKGAMSRVVTQADMDKAFKDNGAPMLETNERGQLRTSSSIRRTNSTATAGSTKKTGVAHIPIQRAMDLIVQQGLPVVPQGMTGGTTTGGITTDASKAPEKKGVEAPR